MVRDMEQVSTPSATSKDMAGVASWLTIEGRDNFFMVWGLNTGAIRLAQFDGTSGETILRRRYTDVTIYNAVPYKMRHFLNRRFLWLVVTYRSVALPRKYTVAVYQVNGTMFTQRQVIEADTYVDIDVMQFKSVVYMAMSTDHSVKMYVWRDTQFDEATDKNIPGVRSVVLLRIDSEIYLATAQDDPKKPRNSQLFLYKPKSLTSGTLISHQVIETKGEHTRVAHFILEGHDYLVYAGKDGATIFWWVSGGFIEYQQVDKTKGAKDVTILTLADGEILLALLYPQKISFYTQSVDSRWVEVYVKQFPSVQLSGVHLASFANKYLYAFLTTSGQNSVNPIWKINLIPFYQRHRQSKDPLRECLDTLKLELDERDKKLRELFRRMGKVWMVNRPQQITAPVVVEGSLKVLGPANIRKILITTNETNIPQVTHRQVKSRLDGLTRNIGTIGRDLNRYAYKNRSQTIRGKLTFVSPISVATGKMGHVMNPNLVISGVPFRDLQTNVLKRSGDQVTVIYYFSACSFYFLTGDQWSMDLWKVLGIQTWPCWQNFEWNPSPRHSLD